MPPIVNMAIEGQSTVYFEHASDAQLKWISPVAEWAVENADVRIAVLSEDLEAALAVIDGALPQPLGQAS